MPVPWVADPPGRLWSRAVHRIEAGRLPDRSGELAPYPALVAIGTDADGGTWLLDLEAAGTLAITGDPDRSRDLARFLAAELAVNPWADGLTATIIGLEPALADLNPDRLHPADDPSQALEALQARRENVQAAEHTLGLNLATARARGISGDSWMPHILLIGADHAVAQTASGGLVADPILAPRSGTAVVRVDPSTGGTEHRIIVSADGRLTLALGTDVEMRAAGLPADQLADLARLITHAAQDGDAPIPAATRNDTVDAYLDAAGGLRPEHTQPRRTGDAPTTDLPDKDASDEAAPSPGKSVLPEPDQTYLDVAATTKEDLQHLGPTVTAAVRAEIRDADPTLDSDLGDWASPNSATPKLRVLGPVHLTATGPAPAKRIAYYTEIVAYLATRDHGATAEQLAAAFDVSLASVYSRITTVRAWLGSHPGTDRLYLPESSKSNGGKSRGVGVYELDGIAVDADLFRRLRARAQPSAAPPASAASRKRSTSSPVHHSTSSDPAATAGSPTPPSTYLTAGIVDVAHTIHLHHLQTGDLRSARAATEVALTAAPYDDTPRWTSPPSSPPKATLTKPRPTWTAK